MPPAPTAPDDGVDLDARKGRQNGDSIEEIRRGELTPSGEIILSLEDDEQSATKGDIAA